MDLPMIVRWPPIVLVALYGLLALAKLASAGSAWVFRFLLAPVVSRWGPPAPPEPSRRFDARSAAPRPLRHDVDTALNGVGRVDPWPESSSSFSPGRPLKASRNGVYGSPVTAKRIESLKNARGGHSPVIVSYDPVLRAKFPLGKSLKIVMRTSRYMHCNPHCTSGYPERQEMQLGTVHYIPPAHAVSTGGRRNEEDPRIPEGRAGHRDAGVDRGGRADRGGGAGSLSRHAAGWASDCRAGDHGQTHGHRHLSRRSQRTHTWCAPGAGQPASGVTETQRAMRHLRLGNQRGTSTLEFVVVLPTLLIIFLGGLELSRAWLTANIAAHAAREGARVGVV